MSSVELSVVMPVHNEAEHLPATLDALVEAVAASGFERVEVVLVDDGSTDGSAAVVERSLAGRLSLRVLPQPNRGRFHARHAGLDAATGERVLLLDGRVRLRPGSLAFVRSRIEDGEEVWNGHVHVDTEGNPYGAFGDMLVRLAWSEYFDDPRTTSFGVDDFDRFPKGTGCFLAPRDLLLAAVGAFNPRVSQPKVASDDTQLIRWIASRESVHLSPSFSCDYSPRSGFTPFVRHAMHRGSVFMDGHGVRESRFFPVVAAFFPVSAVLAVAALRRPAVVPVLAAASAAAATAVAVRARRPVFDTVAFGALTPVYAVAHGLGMWRWVAIAVRDRLT